MNELQKLKNRLSKIGIEIECFGNYPWIYLDKINGKKVIEKTDDSNHGFNIAWLPVRPKEPLLLANTKEAFKLIRKYIEA